MRRPKFSSLRLFMRVAEAGGFSEAARLLHTSQPALSRSIRLLEEDLGARLFDRDTRNMSLTAAGAMLLPIVERLAGDFDQALAQVQESFSGRRGSVVIGALPSVAASLLPGVIASFQQSHPLVDIVIRDTISGSLYQQMLERQIDFAVTTPPPDDRDEFAYVALQDDPCALVCPVGDELDQPGPANWSVFAHRPFIAMAARSSVRVLTDAGLAKADVVVKPSFECSQMSTIGALIAQGLGISALPLSSIPLMHQANLVARPLVAPRMDRTIGVAHLLHRTLSPAAAAFRTQLIAHVPKTRRIGIAVVAVA